jgi:hypothetical protein
MYVTDDDDDDDDDGCKCSITDHITMYTLRDSVARVKLRARMVVWAHPHDQVS